MKTLLAIALLLSVSGCNSSRGTENASTNPTDAAPNRAVQQSGASTFSSSSGNADCGLSLDSVNTKFTLASVTSRSAPTRHVLVKEEVRQQGCTNSEGMKGTVDLWGWVDQFEAGIASTWQAHAEGHEGEIDGAFYKVTRHGCCGSTAASTYFNLLSGKKIFESTLKPVRVEVPNTSIWRYVGFLDTWSILTPEEAKTNPNVIGALQYGAADTSPERVVVSLKTTSPFSVESLAVASTREPTKYTESLELWSANGKEDPAAVSGFSIRARLIEVGGGDRRVTLVIPVAADRLDLDHATVSDGVELHRVNSR